MTTKQAPAPDWDAIQLPEEYREHLRQLKADSRRLRKVVAVGSAFISYMASPEYADTEGEALGEAFRILAEHDEA